MFTINKTIIGLQRKRAMFSWESTEEAAFELSFEELFIRCGHGKMGGNYTHVAHLGTLSKNSLQCHFLIIPLATLPPSLHALRAPNTLLYSTYYICI